MKVEIISREQIKPSSPTPSHDRSYKLSLFDQISPPFYFPPILFYFPEETNMAKQSELSSTLKRSLSDALTLFYPLAGRMEGEKARLESHISDFIERPRTEELNQLIPLDLTVQVSFFTCGGMVIGICISHGIADGCTLSTFVEAWAACARGDPHVVCPSFISASLFPPREPLGFNPTAPIPEQGLVIKRLVFSVSSMAALKARVSPVQPTRVEIVTALIWKCVIGQHRTISTAFHPVNMKRRMVPAIPDHIFGNLFLMTDAVNEGEVDLAALAAKIGGAIRGIEGDYARQRQGEKGFDVLMRNLDRIVQVVSKGEVQVFRFSSWCGFPIYEANFGAWASHTVFLMDTRCLGGVEAWMINFEGKAE
ncbi:Vinorine synthase [Bertholletia excelsa]